MTAPLPRECPWCGTENDSVATFDAHFEREHPTLDQKRRAAFMIGLIDDVREHRTETNDE